MAEFKGTVELIGGLTPKNNGDFPLVNAKDVQVDDTGTRLDQKLQELSTGGGDSGDNSAVVVEILNSDGVITASHSASEIFTLAQAGKVLVARVVSATGELRYQYSRSNVAVDGSVIAAIFSTTFVGEQLNDVTTYYVCVDDSKGVTITYDELLIGGGSSGGDQTAAEMLEGFERDAGSVKKYVDDNLSGKVDAEEGMGLSSNDFTDAQRRMLDVHEQSISRSIDDILQVQQTADELQLKLDGFETKEGSVKGYIDDCLGDKSDIDHDHDGTYAAKSHNHEGVYQPAGSYAASDHNHDGTYAKPSDIPTVPQTLPNPYSLSLLGKTYNGASAVSLTVDELIAAIKTASGGVIAWVGDDNNIYLSGNLLAGNYKAYYEVDGEYIEIGDLTLAEEETPEPEPTTYTVTFVADGITVAEEKYTADNPVVNEPTVPAKDGYTGEWADYDLSLGGDITVEAVYTAIKPDATTHTVTWVDDDGTVLATDTVADGDTPEYNGTALSAKVVGSYTHNFIGWAPEVGAVKADTTYMAVYADWGYKSGYRIRSSGAEASQSGVYCTDYIPVSFNDTVYIKGVAKHATNGYNSIVFYKSDGDTQIAFTDFTNKDLSYDSKNDIYSFKVRSGFISALTENCGVARFRFSCGDISKDTIITVNETIK